MLHELLFALSGYYGGVIKDTGEGIKVVKGLPFLSPSEEELLNRACKLGTYCKKFREFVRKHEQIFSALCGEDAAQYSQQQHGLYVMSFAVAINAVLDSYMQKLGDLEEDILEDPHLGVPHILCELSEYELLFPALDSVIEQVETQKAHGCYILEIMHKNRSGLPVVEKCLQRMIRTCNQVMYKQLSTWTLHGELYDEYREFFVQPQREGTSAPTGEDQQQQHDDLGVGGVPFRQLQKLSFEPISSPPEGSQFVLRSDLLPSYIPVRVANKILFVGESIQMFQLKRGGPQKTEGPIPHNVLEHFRHKFTDLSRLEEFSLLRFEETVDEIRLFVAERLWRLIVEDFHLINQLKVIKDFFLMGRGELYLAFIDKAEDILMRPPISTTEYDVNVMFQQAANVLMSDEALVQRFRLNISHTGTPSKAKIKKVLSREEVEDEKVQELGWKNLSLKYRVGEPLHILLTDTVLDRYNTVFQFLLAVKRAQLKLQKCWLLQMQGRKSQISLEERAKWQLRIHMAFLVDNLQYYLQVDVIDSLFSILVEKINTTRDFEAIKSAHDQFVAGLLTQSFVHMKPVSQCLHELLDLCSLYCHVIHSCGTVMTKVQVKSMENVAKKFQWQSSLLFKLLTSVRDNSASPHLAQLLLRLDYNRYFTTSGGQLGSLDESVLS